jgi:hypothetical protein
MSKPETKQQGGASHKVWRMTRILVLAGVLLFSAAPRLHAGWSYTSLQPATGYTYSYASSISGGQVGGSAVIMFGPLDRQYHPVYWSSPTPGGFTDLYWNNVPGEVLAVNSGLQGGNLHYGAVYWQGVPGSHKIPDNEGAESSYIRGLSGGWAGGNLIPDGGFSTAVIWQLSSTGSLPPVHLAPQNSVASAVLAISGAGDSNPGVQVGVVDESAALWYGTAGSYLNLNPANAYHSRAAAVYGAYQGGWAQMDVDLYHAALWNGTAASFQDLHPALSGVTDSFITGVAEEMQAGRILFNEDPQDTHAFLWLDSATKYLDLQSVLSPDYTASSAAALERVGNDIWVVGRASNP